MILAPSYPIVAGPVHLWPSLPETPAWPTRRTRLRMHLVGRRAPTPEELAGLGSFFKKVAHAVSRIATAPIKLISPKLASNLQKIDNKVIDTADKIATKINDAAKSVGKRIAKALGKNWKWIAVVVAIAITIYSMGAGATIAAHMISGMQALGHAIAAGAAAVGHAVGIGTAATGATATGAAASAGAALGTGAAAGAAGASAVGVSAAAGGLSASTAGWLATAGKLAVTAAKALAQQKAKVSDLSQQQAQALLEAHAAGYNMGLTDQLQQALETRAAIPGAGIPTDAQGNPLVGPQATGAGVLLPDGTVAAVDASTASYAAAHPEALVPMPAGLAPASSGFGAALASNPYLIPALVGGGALLLVVLLRR